jgi:hypothetical protein
MIKGLSKVKKVESRPSVKIDLSEYAEEECFVELKEPTAAALFPDNGTLHRLKIKFPTYPEAMLYQIALLGKCYVDQPGEPESFNSMNDFGDLAKNNKECFYHILTEFLAAFPTSNFDERVTEAKNG